jgi:hypothetical protein
VGSTAVDLLKRQNSFPWTGNVPRIWTTCRCVKRVLQKLILAYLVKECFLFMWSDISLPCLKQPDIRYCHVPGECNFYTHSYLFMNNFNIIISATPNVRKQFPSFRTLAWFSIHISLFLRTPRICSWDLPSLILVMWLCWHFVNSKNYESDVKIRFWMFLFGSDRSPSHFYLPVHSRCRGCFYFHLITLRHTPHSVGLLWTRDRPVPAETSTWEHKHCTRQTSMPRWDSNPQFQQALGRRPTP